MIKGRDMTTIAEIIQGGTVTYEGRELTTSDVIKCAHEIERLSVEAFISRPRVTEAAVREWLVVNRPGADTTRQEFDEAVRRYLMGRWGIK